MTATLQAPKTFGASAPSRSGRCGAKHQEIKPNDESMISLGKLLSPRREKAMPSEHPDLPYIGLEHVEAHSTKLLGFVPATEMRSTAKRFYSGDVLYSRLRPYLNKVWHADRDGLCSSEFIVLPGNDEVDANFLRYRLNAADFVAFANSLNAGDRPRVDFDQISSFCIFPFSLAHQRQIVAEIEKQFTRLEAGVTALKRVQANLKRYRAAVLKAACEGKLVQTEAEIAKAEGRSYETGEQLLQRILTERRKNWSGRGKYKEPMMPDTSNLPKLPEGWVYASVEALGFVQLGRQRSPKHHHGANMRPYLRVANVYEDRIDLRDVKEMNFTPEEFETFRLMPNDILLNEGQSLELVGRPAIYRGELEGLCFTNTLVRFRPCPSLDVKFALSAFRAFMHSGRFQKIANWTTNIAHLGADRFAKMAFPLPPIAEQKRIVEEVERRLSVIDELESVVKSNLQRATRLRQSILQKAFKGDKLAADNQ